ncbi:MAG: T9SS type A sorting domain-containing protein [Bacteroidales bacterium]|nr:T9SS type A sorting domain-containing protein [Bacteroidales bacterium]
MKKFYTLIFTATLLSLNLTAQENILLGSSMEIDDEDSWMVSELNSDAGSGDYEFGYDLDVPYDGTGAALRITINGSSAGTRHVAIYQEVTLRKDSEYVLDYAVATVGEEIMNNSWIENYLGLWDPAEQAAPADYVASDSAAAISGFKFDGWESSCSEAEGGPGNSFDGLFSEIGCIGDGPETIDGDSLFNDLGIEDDVANFYLLIKTGIWGMDAVLTIVMDNVTLTEYAPVGIPSSQVASLNVFPNPTDGTLNISDEINVTGIEVLSVLGQTIISVNENTNTLDVSSLTDGIYIIKVTDANNNILVTKFRKI